MFSLLSWQGLTLSNLAAVHRNTKIAQDLSRSTVFQDVKFPWEDIRRLNGLCTFCSDQAKRKAYPFLSISLSLIISPFCPPPITYRLPSDRLSP